MSPEQSSENFLKNIQIASPCPMNWSDMARTSDEAKRFCGDCRKHVFSIDKLSTKEAHTLIQSACANNSSVCVRLFKRADGTIITDDCPVGLRRVRDTWRKIKSSAATLMLCLGVLPAVAAEKDDCKTHVPVMLGRVIRPKATTTNTNAPALPLATMGEPMMIDYRAEALKIASIKAFSDRINTLDQTKDETSNNKAEIVRLRLDMAREAMKKNQYAFASDQLSNNLVAVKQLPDTTSSAKNLRSNLTRDVLKEKLICIKQLKMTDTEGLQQQLDTLQQKK